MNLRDDFMTASDFLKEWLLRRLAAC